MQKPNSYLAWSPAKYAPLVLVLHWPYTWRKPVNGCSVKILIRFDVDIDHDYHNGDDVDDIEDYVDDGRSSLDHGYRRKL